MVKPATEVQRRELAAMGWREIKPRRLGGGVTWVRQGWGLKMEPGSQWIGTIQADPDLVEMDSDPVRLARTLEQVVTKYQPAIERIAEPGDLLVTVEPTLHAGALVQVGVITRAARAGIGLRYRLPSGDVRQVPAERGQVERWLIVADVVDGAAAMKAMRACTHHPMDTLDEMRDHLRPFLRTGISQKWILEQRQKRQWRRQKVAHG